MVTRVAVIGCGAAGLVALRHLAARPETFAPQAFEQTNAVGGTWVYTDRVGVDANGLPVHSSMYKNMLTNLPKEVMPFPDFPFPSNLPSFMKHQDVRQYLDDYADHFNLRQFIKFNTVVNRVHPVLRNEKQAWEVIVSRVGDPEAKPEVAEFDAVMVCNGHYSIPLLPEIPGLENFSGKILHSHNYRIPEPFADQKVAVLGAASSGQDISLEIAKHAKKVFLCHRKEQLKSPLPDNLTQAPGIKEIKGNIVIFDNAEEAKVDALIFCTGYRFVFPFLTPECHLEIIDERVSPLYKHIVHTEYPSLSFMGLCKIVCPFPQFHCQVLFVLAALTGQMTLPSKVDMDKDTEKDYQWRLAQGMPHRHAHTMGTLQWGYNDMLAELAGFEPIPRVVRKLYDHVHAYRVTQLQTYKQINYALGGPDGFVEV